MDLWVRTQNKENLLKIFNITIDSRRKLLLGNLISDDNKSICDYWELGRYKTTERALEVLDEIQNLLMPKCIINPKSMKFSKPYEENGMVLMDCNSDARIEQISTYVYNMPEE